VREDTLRNLGHFSAVSLFLFLLPISSLVSVNSTFASTEEGQFPQSIIASSSTDTTPHLLELKVTQQGGTESRVSGFSLDVTNTVSAQMNSQLLVFVTDSSVRIIEAKVRTASNQVINLVPSTSPQTSNAFSLTNLPAGVYALDVITQKGNTKAAYEGILAIGQQPLTVIEETTRRVTNEYGDLIIIFLPGGPPPGPGPCPPGQVRNEKGVCVPIECPEGQARNEGGVCGCPEGQEGIPPDCEPICPDGSTQQPGEECPPEPPIICPDGSAPPPGEECPPEPPDCNVEDPPPECEEQIVCDDGSTVPPGEECPEPPGPPECPEGQVGTPPDCETPPGILPPPDNGDEPPPDNGDEPPPDNGDEPPPDNGDEGGDEGGDEVP
jgi:hypothetical protein